MVVAVSARGCLIWRITSQEIRAHWAQLQIYLHAASFNLVSWDFGLGPEQAFRCVSCNRFCPVQTATLDHDVARSRVRMAFIAPPLYGGPRIDPYFSGNTFHMYQDGELSVVPIVAGGGIQRLHYHVDNPNGSISCFQPVYNGGQPTILYRWPVSDFLTNMLGNLQPMCAHCNSTKGNRW